MSIFIRKAEENNILPIQEMEKNIYSDPWPRVLFQLVLSRAADLFLVATQDEEIFGYVVGEIESEQSILMGHILNLAIKENWRNKGYGDILLKEVEKGFLKKGASEAYLEVRVSNIIAQNLYKKNGYQIKGVLKKYYTVEDGYRMEKKFQQ